MPGLHPALLAFPILRQVLSPCRQGTGGDAGVSMPVRAIRHDYLFATIVERGH
jgi:hypothetical protein